MCGSWDVEDADLEALGLGPEEWPERGAEGWRDARDEARQEALEIGRLLLSVPISENSSVEMKTPRLQGDLELEVKSFAVLVHRIHFRSVRDIHEPMTLAFVPSFELSDGYVVPQGFEFSYYLPGTASSLEIPAKEQVQ